MDLQTILTRTKLSPRRLRYVLDHEMIPDLAIQVAEHDAGQPRTFNDYNGFRIACAAMLLEAGMKREPAAQFVAAMARLNWANGGSYLRQVFELKKPAFARLGDGRAVELQFGNKSPLGWFPLVGSAKRDAEFVPLTVVEIDLGRLRDSIRG